MKPAKPGAFRVHFHASSVGEFEQAKPLIEALRAEPTVYRITASFFSPSGYESQKDYEHIDGACYIPHDRQQDMNEFLNRLTPDLIIVIRYDLWLEFMRQAELRTIPVVLVCGVLRSNSIRFVFGLRRFFSALYGRLSMIHCVTEEDRLAFETLTPSVPTEVSGDTRFDRVAKRLSVQTESEDLEVLRKAVGGRTVIVAGSTWREDERMLRGLTERSDLFLIIVPHEPGQEEITAALDQFPGAATLSEVREHGSSTELRGVIVDRLGLLADLYRLADIAYVGGGFGAGVHSVLEPAVFGIPVLTGPKTSRSRDATAMKEAGLLLEIESPETLAAGVDRLISDPNRLKAIGRSIEEFIDQHLGATQRIINSLRKQRLLPAKVSVRQETRNADSTA